MVKYKSTGEVLKIIKNKDQIRNFGIIAHVDLYFTIFADPSNQLLNLSLAKDQ